MWSCLGKRVSRGGGGGEAAREDGEDGLSSFARRGRCSPKLRMEMRTRAQTDGRLLTEEER